MAPKKDDSTLELLKDRTGEIAALRKMGITDYAIMTYLVRVGEGLSRAEALRGLLEGRNLPTEQAMFIRTVLERFPIPTE